MTILDRRFGGALVLLFLVALGLRVLATQVAVGLGAPPDFAAFGLDVVEYEGLAWSLSEGRGYSMSDGTPTARRAPGTSFTLFAVYALVGRSFLAARLWICALSALTCVVVAWMARPFLGSLVAFLAGAWLAVYPGHIYYATHMLSESVFGLYLMLGIGLTLRSLGSPSHWAKSIRTGVVAGVFWGMAVLTRPFILVAVPFGWILALCLPGHRRMRTGMLLIQTLAMLAVVMPWVIRNDRVMGQATLVTLAPALAFFGAHHEDTLNDPRLIGYWTRIRLDDPRYPLYGTELEMAATCWRYGMDSVRRHADQMPKLVLYKLWRLVTPFPHTAHPLLKWLLAAGWLTAAPFVLIGFWMVVQRAPALATVLVLPLLATLAAVLVAHGAPRFRHALAPCFLIFAATALAELAQRVGQPCAYLHNRS